MTLWQVLRPIRGRLLVMAAAGFLSGFTYAAGTNVTLPAWHELGALVTLGEVYAVQMLDGLRP